MPDSEVSVKFSTKAEADLWRAFVKLGAEAAKAGDAGANAAAGISKIDPAIRRFASSAKQIVSTPLEKFQANVEKLDKAMTAGLVTADQYARIKDKFSQQLTIDATPVKEVSDEERKAALEAEKAAAETTKFAESIKKITATPLDRLNEKMERLRAAYKAGAVNDKQFKSAHDTFQNDFAVETAIKATRAGATLREENQKTAASNKMLANSAASTWANIVTAVSTATHTITSLTRSAFQEVRQAMQEMRQQRDQAAANMSDTLKSQGSLAQLGATPEENAKLTQIADAAYATGTVETRQQGADFTKSLSNANKLDEVKLFGRMQRSGIVTDAGQFAGMVNTLQTSMGAEAGTSQELASMTFQAGTKSYDDVNALIKGAAKAGSAAKGAGKTTPELLAGTAIMSQALGGSDVAGERMKAFMEAIERNKSLQGKSLVETLALIKKKTGGRTDRMLKLLGSSEAMNAAQVLGENTDALTSQISDIENARTQDFASQKMAYLESQPARQAEILRRRKAATAELEKEKALGPTAAAAQAAVSDESANARLGKIDGAQSAAAWGALRMLRGGLRFPYINPFKGKDARIESFSPVPAPDSGLAKEAAGYLTHGAGYLRRTWNGDEDLLRERAASSRTDTAERQVILDSLQSGDRVRASQELGVPRAEADALMGIESGPRAVPDHAAAELTRQQMEAARKQSSSADALMQVANLFMRSVGGQSTTASPVFSGDVSRRAQQQHAVPAE